MAQSDWIKAADSRLINPAHVVQFKQVHEKIVLTMAGGDTRTLYYDSKQQAAETLDELEAHFAGLDIGGELSEFQV